MSNAYRLHGTRFLRKYTAAEKSSSYAYMADVRKIADTLCTVPWQRVTRDIPATFTVHTEEGIDWNAPERDRFDAAEWCAEHADEFHRAYAQAACYVFELPDSAVGTLIEKIRVNVSSDPYNPYGARISALTSETLDIPMDCQTVREGDVFREPDEDGMGAAPRLYRRNSDGTQTWYANREIVELLPGALAAKKYLIVFVCLENYNRGREGWIEGSSYIDNDVELTLAAPCDDLVEGELNDSSLQTVARSMAVAVGETLPYVMPGQPTGRRSLAVRADANLVIESDGTQSPSRTANGSAAAAAVGRLYALFFSGLDNPEKADGHFAQTGAAFNVERLGESHVSVESDRPAVTDILRIDSSVLVVPFVFPGDFDANVLRLDYSELNLPPGARFNIYLASEYLTNLSAETLANPGLYDGSTPPLALLGVITGGSSTEFKIPSNSGRVGSVVISGWFPPGRVDLSASGPQGTGLPFFPEISITE